MKTCALRLRPGEDPKAALDSFAQAQPLSAASVLRFVNQEESVTPDGHFIVTWPDCGE